MPKLGDILKQATLNRVRKAVYVPYCEHTKKPGDTCPFHCRPGAEFLKFQKELRKARARASEWNGVEHNKDPQLDRCLQRISSCFGK